MNVSFCLDDAPLSYFIASQNGSSRRPAVCQVDSPGVYREYTPPPFRSNKIHLAEGWDNEIYHRMKPWGLY